MERVFKLNIYSFIIALIIGLIYIHISTPKPRAIIKYPTPYNTNKLVYKNVDDNCYKFKYTEVECSKTAIDQPLV